MDTTGFHYQPHSMKSKQSPRTAAAIAILMAGSFIGCGPAHFIGTSEIPTAKTLSPVMWSQAELADPAFKKITATAYEETDWTAFSALGQRLQVASAKLKQDFSQGADWDTLADALGVHGRELVDATRAKDMAAASTALTATRATCRTCHKEFR